MFLGNRLHRLGMDQRWVDRRAWLLPLPPLSTVFFFFLPMASLSYLVAV